MPSFGFSELCKSNIAVARCALWPCCTWLEPDRRLSDCVLGLAYLHQRSSPLRVPPKKDCSEQHNGQRIGGETDPWSCEHHPVHRKGVPVEQHPPAHHIADNTTGSHQQNGELLVSVCGCQFHFFIKNSDSPLGAVMNKPNRHFGG